MFTSNQVKNKNNAFVLNNAGFFYTPAMKNRVKEIRKKRKMSQSDLAEAVGTSLRNIQYIEAGERGLEVWMGGIAKALDVPKRDLIDEPEKERQSIDLPSVLEKPSEGIAIHVLDNLSNAQLDRVLSRYGRKLNSRTEKKMK